MSSSSDELFLEELLSALRKAGLEALIVGSVAAALQRVPLTTQDVDLLVRDSQRNREKLTLVARALGAQPVHLSPGTSSLRLVGGRVPVDVVFDELPSSKLTFNALRSRALRLEVGREKATVTCLNDVIASKEAAGRPKDAAQLIVMRDTLRVIEALSAHDDEDPPG